MTVQELISRLQGILQSKMRCSPLKTHNALALMSHEPVNSKNIVITQTINQHSILRINKLIIHIERNYQKCL